MLGGQSAAEGQALSQVEHYRPRGGVVPGLAALRGVAAHQRVIGRQTSAPLTEALLFAVAGGIGAAYTSPRDPDGRLSPRLDLGARYRGRPGEALQALCVRLGLPASFRHTPRREVAERGLREALHRDEPVIAFVSAGGLPFLASPGAWADEPVRAVVVCGMSGDDGDEVVILADLGPKPMPVKLGVFREAWGADRSLKHLMASVDAPAMAVDLPKAIEAGLRACSERLIDPPHPRQDYGLTGLTRLARALRPSDDPDAWSAQLDQQGWIYESLRDLFVSIELSEAGPSGGRGLFAKALSEASEVLQGPNLSEVIRSYEQLARGWRELGEAALPGHVSELDDLRGMLVERQELLREQPDDEADALVRLSGHIRDLDAQLRDELPLRPPAITELLRELADRLNRLVSDEAAAIESLKLIIR